MARPPPESGLGGKRVESGKAVAHGRTGDLRANSHAPVAQSSLDRRAFLGVATDDIAIAIGFEFKYVDSSRFKRLPNQPELLIVRSFAVHTNLARPIVVLKTTTNGKSDSCS